MRIEIKDIKSDYGFSFDFIADESGIQINVAHNESTINRVQIEPILIYGIPGQRDWQGVVVKTWEQDKWAVRDPNQTLAIVQLFDEDDETVPGTDEPINRE